MQATEDNLRSGEHYELSLIYCEEVSEMQDKKIKLLRKKFKEAPTLAEKLVIMKEIGNREKLRSAFRSVCWEIQDLLESKLDKFNAIATTHKATK